MTDQKPPMADDKPTLDYSSLRPPPRWNIWFFLAVTIGSLGGVSLLVICAMLFAAFAWARWLGQ